jgi:hypothetical protein
MVDMDVTIERPILWTQELYTAHSAAEARAAEEAAARKILERQIRALEEELALLRRG